MTDNALSLVRLCAKKKAHINIHESAAVMRLLKAQAIASPGS